MYPPVHENKPLTESFERLEMLWERYPKYHGMTTFSTLDALLEEHESYRTDFEEDIRQEYLDNRYDRFLVQLSWQDLPYRYATKRLIEREGAFLENPYLKEFMSQFEGLDTEHKAFFLLSLTSRSIVLLTSFIFSLFFSRSRYFSTSRSFLSLSFSIR